MKKYLKAYGDEAHSMNQNDDSEDEIRRAYLSIFK